MMKNFILTITLLTSLVFIKYTAFAQKDKDASATEMLEAVSKRFQRDAKQGNLKYYIPGIAPSNYDKKKIMNQYQIKIMDMGCMMSPDDMQYNALVEQYCKDNYKISMQSILEANKKDIRIR